MSTYMMAAGAEMPIGYIFEFDATGLTGAPDLSTAAKVREYFGYGTWAAYGAGRVTVGAGGGYAVGSEGGEATHTLTVEEMPKHGHYEIFGDGSTPNQLCNNLRLIVAGGTNYGTALRTNWEQTGLGDLVYTGSTGENHPHNNLQPYRTVYRWRRIA